MYSIGQIANAYNFKQVRTFKVHVKDSGLARKLPKLLNQSATIYRFELYTIMEFLGKTPKISKMYELPEK